MSDEPDKPPPESGWEWASHYVLGAAFSGWLWSKFGTWWAIFGVVFGVGIIYLMHREAKAGRLD
jgi:hypothetical protein